MDVSLGCPSRNACFSRIGRAWLKFLTGCPQGSLVPNSKLSSKFLRGFAPSKSLEKEDIFQGIVSEIRNAPKIIISDWLFVVIFRSEEGTTKNLFDNYFAKLSGELSGAICLNQAVLCPFTGVQVLRWKLLILLHKDMVRRTKIAPPSVPPPEALYGKSDSGGWLQSNNK